MPRKGPYLTRVSAFYLQLAICLDYYEAFLASKAEPILMAGSGFVIASHIRDALRPCLPALLKVKIKIWEKT